jgi:hypothetical protein
MEKDLLHKHQLRQIRHPELPLCWSGRLGLAVLPAETLFSNRHRPGKTTLVFRDDVYKDSWKEIAKYLVQ